MHNELKCQNLNCNLFFLINLFSKILFCLIYISVLNYYKLQLFHIYFFLESILANLFPTNVAAPVIKIVFITWTIYGNITSKEFPYFTLGSIR